MSLDKVTRFQREITLGRSKWYLATIIIVDRIGPSSRIEALAKRVGGTIVQMSMGFWPQEIARELEAASSYQHDLASMNQSEIAAYLKRKLAQVPLEKLMGLENE